jgi:hypothetical protein
VQIADTQLPPRQGLALAAVRCSHRDPPALERSLDQILHLDARGLVHPHGVHLIAQVAQRPEQLQELIVGVVAQPPHGVRAMLGVLASAQPDMMRQHAAGAVVKAQAEAVGRSEHLGPRDLGGQQAERAVPASPPEAVGVRR